MQPLEMRHTWTIEDLQSQPLDHWSRYQIIDGALLVSPSASPFHEVVSAFLRQEIVRQVTDDHLVLGPAGVSIARSYLIPDLLVMLAAGFHAEGNFEPRDTLLVVEIESPSSVTTDRLLKPAKYAAAGIAHYWRVETDPVRLCAYSLPTGSGVYVETGSWGVGQTAELSAPFPVSIEIARLSKGHTTSQSSPARSAAEEACCAPPPSASGTAGPAAR